MILVTVGSSLPFDDLVEAVDRFVKMGDIQDAVVCQIGRGNYVPTSCEYFRFAPSLEEWVRKASVVIGHGGTGTVSEMLAERKPFVAVPNPGVQDDHQAVFLEHLSQCTALLWTRDLNELPHLVARAPAFHYGSKPGQRLADEIRRYVLNDDGPGSA